LLDEHSHLGGTARHSLIHTLAGFYDSEGELLNNGLSFELLDRLQSISSANTKRRLGKVWVFNVDPCQYGEVLSDWLQESNHITFLPQSTITQFYEQAVGNDVSIRSVDIKTPKHTYQQAVSAVVDATGKAAIVQKWHKHSYKKGEALAGFIIQLCGVDVNTLKFPKGIALLKLIRKSSKQGVLPPECALLWLDSGVFVDEVYVKFNLVLADWNKAHMHQVAQILLRFLQQQKGFEKAYINRYGEVGIRDGGEITGRYYLTEMDIKQGKVFDDTACYGAWPIEYWDISKGVKLDYFPPKHRYAIPLRSLQLKTVHNFWVAGKCFSAAPNVRASTRVIGMCWAMGEAVGIQLTSGDHGYNL